MKSKREIQYFLDEMAKKYNEECEYGAKTIAVADEVRENKVVIRFASGVPNLSVVYDLMGYFGVPIENISMYGDGEDIEYSSWTHDHNSWVDVVVNL